MGAEKSIKKSFSRSLATLSPPKKFKSRYMDGKMRRKNALAFFSSLAPPTIFLLFAFFGVEKSAFFIENFFFF